jgi:hypothetical protein
VAVAAGIRPNGGAGGGGDVRYKEARDLAVRIQAEGPYCTVPKGFGPDGYFCRIFLGATELDLRTWDDWALTKTFHLRLLP